MLTVRRLCQLGRAFWLMCRGDKAEVVLWLMRNQRASHQIVVAQARLEGVSIPCLESDTSADSQAMCGSTFAGL